MDKLQTSNVVLVVDDSPDTLRMLTDALDAEGMTVMVALDGASAMRIIDRITPDIILLDAVMPGMDGFETCRQLKANVNLTDVPVIFMTGLAETEHILLGLEVGGVDYVTKPVVVAEMLARIKVHLTNARLAQSARAALDATGRYLFAINSSGEIIWFTPQAQKLLAQDGVMDSSGNKILLPPQWREWLKRMASEKEDGAASSPPAFVQHSHYRLQYMGRVGVNEFLLRLAPMTSRDSPMEFSKELGLTKREGEVLSWLSKGKTNRDIAQILNLSPRTVDKHLEQIYAKLGVENRTAAAAIAVDTSRKRN